MNTKHIATGRLVSVEETPDSALAKGARSTNGRWSAEATLHFAHGQDPSRTAMAWLSRYLGLDITDNGRTLPEKPQAKRNRHETSLVGKKIHLPVHTYRDCLQGKCDWNTGLCTCP